MAGPFTTPVAESVPFDGTTDTNGNPLDPPFVSEDVKAAIIEARDTAQGIAARFTLTLISNGWVSDDEWITYSELTPDIWIQLPFKCELMEYTWANKKTNRSFDLEFYKNGLNNSDIFLTEQIRNQEYGYRTGINTMLNAGDRVRIKYKDQGNNCSDLVVVLYLIRRE